MRGEWRLATTDSIDWGGVISALADARSCPQLLTSLKTCTTPLLDGAQLWLAPLDVASGNLREAEPETGGAPPSSALSALMLQAAKENRPVFGTQTRGGEANFDLTTLGVPGRLAGRVALVLGIHFCRAASLDDDAWEALAHLANLLAPYHARWDETPLVAAAPIPAPGVEGDLGLIGASAAMESVRTLIRQFGNSHAHVIVTGEPGTGKELIAQALHRCSPRGEKTMVVTNCAGIPENLADSALFGHVRGAFTGAAVDSAGLFEVADESTLFLDEVGELPIGIQAKLLRAVQEGEVQRVGDYSSTRRVDVRVVGATNLDLVQARQEGNFRDDLYHRLAQVEIHVPPLRERREDIPALAAHLLARSRTRDSSLPGAFSAEALALLVEHDWPGNVRELDACVLRGAIAARYAEEDVIGTAFVQPKRGTTATAESDGMDSFDGTLEDFENRCISMVLQRCAGNVTDAARRLNISRQKIYERMKAGKLGAVN